MIIQNFTTKIEEASAIVGKTWPLYAFVTSNPLSGIEGVSFEDATQQANKFMGCSALPKAYLFRQAWDSDKIDKSIVQDLLNKADFCQKPEFYLAEMEAAKTFTTENANHQLDRIVAKWLGVFLDEGMAEWEMPGRSKGFYRAWRELAKYDQEIENTSTGQLPATAAEMLTILMSEFNEQEQVDVFKQHIAALPGWTGYIKYRLAENSAWQQKYPINLEEYLAVRLWLAKQLYGKVVSRNPASELRSKFTEVQHIWLRAWEKTFQIELGSRLQSNLVDAGVQSRNEPDSLVQMVFCIDTRSELIRRHIEKKNKYETFGYAGFFGIATDYTEVSTGLVRKSCPPIVASAYTISETAQTGKEKEFSDFLQKTNFSKFSTFLSSRMKNMLPSAFGYVEGAGLLYGFKMFGRTLFPAEYHQISGSYKVAHEQICETEINPNDSAPNQVAGISIKEKVAIVKSAFDLLGWHKFAPLVVFAGHASHSANNPFGSSLDCGACAASPGRHNARMLAKLANLPEVNIALRKDFNINIPDNTFFIGAEHNTTTDEIILFDAEAPVSHLKAIKALKSDLAAVQQAAISERLELKSHGVKNAIKKASNWAETRPEWGLAKNAGFIIAPRSITKHIDLESRCFLHSYDWKLDAEGKFLESIMQGPMVVTQWINNHYYFSTVDNDRFGGGSKITHNVTGKFGVVQGNGGDLKRGLPLQSVNRADEEMFHQPLRLSVFIEAPLKRVSEILERNSQLKSLLDNNWIYLMIIDPMENNQMSIYQNNGSWSLR
ncbi:uncharacterized protein YbcC (UPF0753/DUF2309 family) [Pedobacter sp. CG_S7]|uniref:DUF2309 domain-containing protein n=1 Tax=Pedobacter sp. CG_S7 TaxID=3143930 RepID=UPI00339A8ED8